METLTHRLMRWVCVRFVPPSEGPPKGRPTTRRAGEKENVIKFKTHLMIFWLAVFCYLTASINVYADTSSLLSFGQLSHACVALAERVSPAVVQVIVSGYDLASGNGSNRANMLAQRRTGGSGVILDPDGYIVTNAHVVRGAYRVRVLLVPPVRVPFGRSILPPKGSLIDAQIVGIDSETDLAVLKIEPTGLPALQLGDSDELRPGQLVFAYGSPFGLANSVTMGIVSAVARQLQDDAPMIYIQTDAAINPGNSGGPLVDTNGRVVGINTFILSQSGGNEGIGFAAPSNIVRHVYEQIRRNGRVHRGEIRASAQTITPTLAEGLGLPLHWGVIIGDVFPGGPADKAGLKVGDIVLKLDGKVMENARQFEVNLYQHQAGDTVQLTVLRELDNITIPVHVVQRPDVQSRFRKLVNPEEHLIPELGVFVVKLDPEIARMFPSLRGRGGVVVAAQSASASHQARHFTPGDVIYSMNRAPIKTLAALREAVAHLKVGDSVVFQVERRGRLIFIAFEWE